MYIIFMLTLLDVRVAIFHSLHFTWWHFSRRCHGGISILVAESGKVWSGVIVGFISYVCSQLSSRCQSIPVLTWARKCCCLCFCQLRGKRTTVSRLLEESDELLTTVRTHMEDIRTTGEEEAQVMVTQGQRTLQAYSAIVHASQQSSAQPPELP